MECFGPTFGHILSGSIPIFAFLTSGFSFLSFSMYIVMMSFIQQESNSISARKYYQYGETSLEVHLFDRVGG